MQIDDNRTRRNANINPLFPSNAKPLENTFFMKVFELGYPFLWKGYPSSNTFMNQINTKTKFADEYCDLINQKSMW